MSSEHHDINLAQTMFDEFSFDKLLARYPGTSTVRAGICLVVDSYLLLVRERGGPNANIGPPKGLAESQDVSALGTAIREFREETGIRLNLSKLSGRRYRHSPIQYKLLPKAFCCQNDRHNELSVYFIVAASSRPVIKIDHKEIGAYMWYDMSNGLKKKLSECSEPTKLLFTEFDDTVAYQRWQNVFKNSPTKEPRISQMELEQRIVAAFINHH